jgi:hypothetical protein
MSLPAWAQLSIIAAGVPLSPAWPVSASVGNAKNNDPSLIEPNAAKG